MVTGHFLVVSLFFTLKLFYTKRMARTNQGPEDIPAGSTSDPASDCWNTSLDPPGTNLTWVNILQMRLFVRNRPRPFLALTRFTQSNISASDWS